MHYVDDSKSKFTIISKFIMILAGVILGILITRIFFTTFTVKGTSMIPNFLDQEKVFILKHINPKKNDIVLIESPLEENKYLLKRVIALSGDTVEIKNKIILINNIKHQNSFKIINSNSKFLPIKYSFKDNLPKLTIKQNYIFVLNDNRNNSFDSRTFGAIEEDKIIGKVLFK